MRIFSARSPEPICELPGRREPRLLLLALELVEPGAEDAHRLLPVLELRLLVLHRDDDARRQVGDAHGRVGRVDALAAGPGRAVDVDLEVVLGDLDLDLLDLGHHGDGRRRGVDPPLRLGLGHALDAVGAALVLVDGERAVALDGEHDLLEPARLALVRREDLGLEAAALGVAGQHPEDVARPERGLVAADALADLDDHVLRVGRVALDERRLELLLEPRHVALEIGRHRGELGIVLRVGEVGAGALPGDGELVRRLELLQAPPHLGRLAVVVVDGRVGQPSLQVGVGALELLDE